MLITIELQHSRPNLNLCRTDFSVAGKVSVSLMVFIAL